MRALYDEKQKKQNLATMWVKKKMQLDVRIPWVPKGATFDFMIDAFRVLEKHKLGFSFGGKDRLMTWKIILDSTIVAIQNGESIASLAVVKFGAINEIVFLATEQKYHRMRYATNIVNFCAKKSSSNVLFCYAQESAVEFWKKQHFAKDLRETTLREIKSANPVTSSGSTLMSLSETSAQQRSTRLFRRKVETVDPSENLEILEGTIQQLTPDSKYKDAALSLVSNFYNKNHQIGHSDLFEQLISNWLDEKKSFVFVCHGELTAVILAVVEINFCCVSMIATDKKLSNKSFQQIFDYVKTNYALDSIYMACFESQREVLANIPQVKFCHAGLIQPISVCMPWTASMDWFQLNPITEDSANVQSLLYEKVSQKFVHLGLSVNKFEDRKSNQLSDLDYCDSSMEPKYCVGDSVLIKCRKTRELLFPGEAEQFAKVVKVVFVGDQHEYVVKLNCHYEQQFPEDDLEPVDDANQQDSVVADFMEEAQTDPQADLPDPRADQAEPQVELHASEVENAKFFDRTSDTRNLQSVCNFFYGNGVVFGKDSLDAEDLIKYQTFVLQIFDDIVAAISVLKFEHGGGWQRIFCFSRNEKLYEMLMDKVIIRLSSKGCAYLSDDYQPWERNYFCERVVGNLEDKLMLKGIRFANDTSIVHQKGCNLKMMMISADFVLPSDQIAMTHPLPEAPPAMPIAEGAIAPPAAPVPIAEGAIAELRRLVPSNHSKCRFRGCKACDFDRKFRDSRLAKKRRKL